MVSKHFNYGKYCMVYIIERREMGIRNGINVYLWTLKPASIYNNYGINNLIDDAFFNITINMISCKN
jgi:hypothetical protein